MPFSRCLLLTSPEFCGFTARDTGKMTQGAGLSKAGSANTVLVIASVSFGPSLGAASEQAQHDSGGNPIVVLMSVRAERGSVVIDIEQADFPATGRAEIDSTSHFIRNRVLRSVVTAAAANRGVR